MVMDNIKYHLDNKKSEVTNIKDGDDQHKIWLCAVIEWLCSHGEMVVFAVKLVMLVNEFVLIVKEFVLIVKGLLLQYFYITQLIIIFKLPRLNVPI